MHIIHVQCIHIACTNYKLHSTWSCGSNGSNRYRLSSTATMIDTWFPWGSTAQQLGLEVTAAIERHKISYIQLYTIKYLLDGKSAIFLKRISSLVLSESPTMKNWYLLDMTANPALPSRVWKNLHSQMPWSFTSYKNTIFAGTMIRYSHSETP